MLRRTARKLQTFDDPEGVVVVAAETFCRHNETGELRWQALGLVEGTVLLLVAFAIRTFETMY
ncbi:MAG TPA: hypothetical protein VIY49_34470 [Bryobacteraceae bacterium]